MHDMKHTVGKGVVLAASTATSIVGDHASTIDPVIRAIMFYGGAIGVVLTCCSLGLDVRRKWHKWRMEKKAEDDDETTIT